MTDSRTVTNNKMKQDIHFFPLQPDSTHTTKTDELTMNKRGAHVYKICSMSPLRNAGGQLRLKKADVSREN